MTRKCTQIGVENIKGSGEFYFYLYPLGTKFEKVFKKTFDMWPMLTHVHPCVNYE
jgi:hypothetical protein